MTGLSVRGREFAAAVMLLTRLPVEWLMGGRWAGDPPPFRRTVWAFPVVGALVGVIAGGVWAGLRLCGVPPLPAAVVYVAATVCLTGGLHEDGLADLADACGGRSLERRLDIMRDSRIGSFGALAIVLSVVFRAACVAVLPAGWRGFAAVVACAAVSRFCILLVPCLLPPARPGGLGAMLGRPSAAQMVCAAMLTAFCAAWAERAVWPAWLAACLAALCVCRWARQRLGGFTGDVLGAAEQCAANAGWLVLITV